MALFLIAAGGFAGAVCRTFFGRKLGSGGGGFPYGTLLVNLLGSFMLGYLSAAAVSENAYAFFAIGFTGAFTTFSTLMVELVNLKGKAKIIYLLCSFSGGLIAAFAGFLAGT